MNKREIIACLRLFKSYAADIEVSKDIAIGDSDFRKGLHYGLLFPKLIHIENFSTVVEEAIKQYGQDGALWNSSLHKSFSTVKDTDLETLVFQQVLHYFTVYSHDILSIDDESHIYIPSEKLEIPEVQEDIPLIAIREISYEELQTKLLTLISSGIALSSVTVSDILVLIDYIKPDASQLQSINNREIKTALYDKYGIVPENNIEFIRYLVYLVTGSPLLIQSASMIHDLQVCDIASVYKALSTYTSQPGGYRRLAEVFLRYKNVFLAFKRTESESSYGPAINKIINRLAKLAKKYHKPADIKLIDRLSTYIKTPGDAVYYKQMLLKQLDAFTVYREIGIVNYLRYILNSDAGVALYRIRNGKAWVKDAASISSEQHQAFEKVLAIFMEHLCARTAKLVEGTLIYIPDNVVYTAPTSEKQFLGNIPEGSYIELNEDAVAIGIHWNNLSDERVDLDLHGINLDEHFGWNGSMRSYERQVLFSGDVVDAPLPDGAAEVYYISKGEDKRALLLTLNTFTGNLVSVPYEFVIAKSSEDDVNANYVVDPNKIITQIKSTTTPNENQVTLGLITVNDTIRFYFRRMSLGSSKVTAVSDVTTKTFKALNEYANTQLTLNELLKLSGAVITDSPDAEVESFEEVTVERADGLPEKLFRKVKHGVDVNLSLDNITKETIIGLLNK